MYIPDTILWIALIAFTPKLFSSSTNSPSSGIFERLIASTVASPMSASFRLRKTKFWKDFLKNSRAAASPI